MQERLSYDVVEGGTGPYMLMVHGMLSSRHQWGPNLDALKPHVRPVLLDLWGHGESPAPQSAECFAVEAFVQEFERVREELRADQWILCGQSLGAGLTLRYSLEHPSRTIAQVFTNSISALRPPEDQGSPEQRSAHANAIREEGIAALHRMHFHPRRARRLPDELREFLVDMADRVDPMAAANITEYTSPGLSVLGRIGQIACPTLLVNGGFERGFQPWRDVAVERIPDCRVVDLEAGHAVNLEMPDAFNDAVTTFLQSIRFNSQ